MINAITLDERLTINDDREIVAQDRIWDRPINVRSQLTA
jgi:hypothetical protein